MLDLDGTTFPNNSNAVPSKKVINAVKEAQKEVAVCIATGRSHYKASEVLEILNITNPAILLGGSLIIDGKTHKVIYERPLEKKDVGPILQILKHYNIPVLIDEKARSVRFTDDYQPHKVFNILVIGLTERLANEITKRLSHLPTVTTHKILSWKHGYFDLNISHIYATKQHGILEVAELLDIETHEIIGVGDGPNDFPLLMACGLKIAMGNAVEDLKAIADYVAPPVEEDGVAHIIRKFILSNK